MDNCAEELLPETEQETATLQVTMDTPVAIVSEEGPQDAMREETRFYYEGERVAAPPTMFGHVREDRVVFCVDTSGSMYNALGAVKQHLIDTLAERAAQDRESMFNIVEFSTEVVQWSDRMVRCTPQTVAVARDWIDKLQAKTGTNTLDALMTAFSDPDCNAVCLVTDGYPDQQASDIIDSSVYAAHNRPVHCFYIQDQGNSDPASVDFLQELAMETYGSFHIIAVQNHGVIDRITPIYRAELSAERIIRTTDGNVYPSNHRVCSVSTALTGPIQPVPQVILGGPGVLPYGPPLYPYHYYPYPLRHYYQQHYPAVGWSRYRAARSTLHSPTPDDHIPGAGAMLIGKTVLARRNTDGFFYLGTVKSQILYNKFLVEFGPCKHGRYKDTVYQETFVYDIVSHDDALRHSVVVSDQVLAPWEPEGERYGPGVIIEGQEKRVAQGGGRDIPLIVSFYNGKSASVPQDRALWIPQELHDRITFEIKLPKQVRCEFAAQDGDYPAENLPGYPTSGPRAVPREYDVYQPGWVEQTDQPVPPRINSYVHYNPYYAPRYPVYYKQQPRPSAVTREEVESVIPGTDFTKAELNDKVLSQLLQHKMLLETQRNEAGGRLLRKRDTLDDNTIIRRSIEKSVTFRDPEIDLEQGDLDLDMRDSGRGSQEDDLYFSDLELDDLDLEEPSTQDVADAALHVRPRYQRVRRRPQWKYWSNDPAPNLLEPMHEGPYRTGPYDPSVTSLPADQRQVYSAEHGGVQWGGSMSGFKDYLAQHRTGEFSVRDSLHMPKPPDYKPEKQGPGRSVSETLTGHMSEADIMAQQRLDFRRSRALRREDDQVQQLGEQERMQKLMEDQHRSQNVAREGREQQRHVEDIERLQHLREAKKQINQQIRGRIEERQDWERQRDDQRLASRQAARERRQDIRDQRSQEIEQLRASRDAARADKMKAHWDGVAQRMDEQDGQQAARDQQARNTKVARNQQFQRREQAFLQQKQRQAELKDNSSAVFSSRIFP